MNQEAQAAVPIITIEQAGEHAGRTVTIRGWLYNLRESGKLLFPIFRDGTGIMQGVVSQKEHPEAFGALKGLPQESSVIATGTIRAEARAPGGYEMGVSAIEVVQRVADAEPYPIQLKEHGVDFLLDQRHLWIRTPRQAAILRIRAEAERAARNFMDAQGYTLTDAPIFTPAACEGTTTLFEVNYIDEQKAYLTQSGQLYVEATAAALGKVYTFGPTFRAEKSKTRRHLTEFWMLEPEAAYAHLEDMIQLGGRAGERRGAIGSEKSRARAGDDRTGCGIVAENQAALSADHLRRRDQSAAEGRKPGKVGRRFRRRRRNDYFQGISTSRW